MLIIWFACLVAVVAGEKASCKDEKGKSRDHGETWFDSKQKCKFYKCNDGKITDGFTACIWKDRCYKAGSKWKDGCQNYYCNKTKPYLDVEMYSTEASPRCEHKGKCYKNGETWKIGCDIYRCDITLKKDMYYAKSGPIKMGCKWQKKCKNAGDKWTKGCFNYTCVEYKTKNGTRASRIDLDPGCKVRGPKKCIPVRGFVDIGCSTYKCSIVDNKKVMLVPKKYRCAHKELGCIPEGKSIKENCITYQCGLEKGKLGLLPKTLACEFEGKCVPDGKEWFNSTACVNYKCASRKEKGKKNTIVMKVSASRAGCPWKGSCMKENEKWTDEDCTQRVCRITKKKKRIVHNLDVIRRLCKDAKGKCKDWDAKGFSAIIKDIKFDDCTCEKANKNGSKISCK